jgi:hypothetical protein
MPVVPATQEDELGGFCFEVTPGRVGMRPYLRRQTKSKRTGDMTEVVGSLLRKRKVLGSIPSSTKHN